ncbi:MAG: hypothetical protein QXW69_07740 [Nitrososphaerota archaeon]
MDTNGTTELLRADDSLRYGKLVIGKALKQGKYFLQVVKWWREHYGNYNLVTKFQPAEYKNDIEPNDNVDLKQGIDEAKEVELNKEYTGHLGYYGNGGQDRNDRFKFNLPEDGKLEIVVRNSPTLMTYAYIYDFDGKGELRRDESRRGSYKITIPDLRSGTYYLVLYSAWDIHYGGYEVETVFTPETVKGDKEPNDAFERL